MKYLFVKLFILLSVAATGQVQTIEVRDHFTNLPVQGARISFAINGDSTHLLTDHHGQVRLPVSCCDSNLKISHAGYLPGQVKAEFDDKPIRLLLIPLGETLQEVVVTGHASPIPANEAVRQVRVISQADIQRQSAVNLRNLLSRELNFQITEDAILGSRITMQGLGGAKVKILIDGVPVIGRLDGNIDLSQINLNNVDRVEVVEGPMSVQFGTDAVAGTINLITDKKAPDGTEVLSNAYYESVGRYNFDGSVSFPVGRFSTDLSLGRNYFNGYNSVPSARDQQWNPKEQYFVSAGLRRKVGNLILRYRGDFFDEEIFNAGEIGSMDSIVIPVDTGAWIYPRALDDYYKTYRLNNSIYADYYLKPDMKIRGFVAYNYYKRVRNSVIKNLTTGDEYLFAGINAQDTTMFGSVSSRLFFQHNYLPGKLSYQLGYDFGYNNNLGSRIENGYQSITDVALFGMFEYQPTNRLNFQPGLRYAYNSRFKAPLISSLAFRYQVNDHLIFRSSFGQGFRAPSLKELYFLFVDENHNILGNENLKAERSENYQLSLNYTKTIGNTALEATVRGFFNAIRNEIRLVSIIDPDNQNPRGLYRNENIDRTQTTGTNIDLALKRGGWNANTGVAIIGVKNYLAFSELASGTGNSNFAFHPQIRASVHYVFEKAGLIPALLLNYTGDRTDLVINAEDQLVTSAFDPYTLIDFTVQKKVWNNRFTISTGIKNLLNVTNIQSGTQTGSGAHNAGNNSVPVSYGRTWFVRVQMRLP